MLKIWVLLWPFLLPVIPTTAHSEGGLSENPSFLESAEEFNHFHKTLIDLLLRIEKKTSYPNKVVEQGGQLEFSILEERTLNNIRNICFFGGWPSLKFRGECLNPWLENDFEQLRFLYPKYRKDFYCEGKRKFRCNPLVFGQGVDKRGICISLFDMSRTARKCSESFKKGTEHYENIIKNKTLRDHYLLFIYKLSEHCSNNPEIVECDFLSSYRAHLKSITLTDNDLRVLMGRTELKRKNKILNKISVDHNQVYLHRKKNVQTLYPKSGGYEITTFNMIEQKDYKCEDAKKVMIYDQNEKVIGLVCPSFILGLKVYGFGKLNNNKVIHLFITEKLIDGTEKNKFLYSPKRCDYGISNLGECLIPYKSVVVAKELGYVAGSKIQLSEYSGIEISPGFVHDGEFVVAGQKKFSKQSRISIFVGVDTRLDNLLLSGKKKKNLKSQPKSSEPALSKLDLETMRLAYKNEFEKIELEGWPKEWSEHVLLGIKKNSILLNTKSEEVIGRCPKFLELSKEQKSLFWLHFFRALAYVESKFRADSGVWKTNDTYSEYRIMDKIKGEKLENSYEGLLRLNYQDSDLSGMSCDFDHSKDYEAYKILSKARSTAHKDSFRHGQSGHKRRDTTIQELVKYKYLSQEKANLLSKMSIHSPLKNLQCGVRILETQLLVKNFLTSNTKYYWDSLQRSDLLYPKFLELLGLSSRGLCAKAKSSK
ncbi:hypothetical protein N9O57_00395 [bacterium]|nr:hypothetical protein [bacterium]